jgi:hypothetical protein
VNETPIIELSVSTPAVAVEPMLPVGTIFSTAADAINYVNVPKLLGWDLAATVGSIGVCYYYNY